MSCLICGNQVARHYFAARGTMIVKLCRECKSRTCYKDMQLITAANETCPQCPQFGRCCKTKSAEGTL